MVTTEICTPHDRPKSYRKRPLKDWIELLSSHINSIKQYEPRTLKSYRKIIKLCGVDEWNTIFLFLEKGLLRKPEVVLFLASELFVYLKRHIQPSSSFLNALLQNLKSKDAVIRQGTVVAMQKLSKYGHVKVEELVQIIEPLLQVKPLLPLDQRISILSLALSLKDCNEPKICHLESFVKLAQQETNEQLLNLYLAIISFKCIALKSIPMTVVDLWKKQKNKKRILASIYATKDLANEVVDTGINLNNELDMTKIEGALALGILVKFRGISSSQVVVMINSLQERFFSKFSGEDGELFMDVMRQLSRSPMVDDVRPICKAIFFHELYGVYSKNSNVDVDIIKILLEKSQGELFFNDLLSCLSLNQSPAMPRKLLAILQACWKNGNSLTVYHSTVVAHSFDVNVVKAWKQQALMNSAPADIDFIIASLLKEDSFHSTSALEAAKSLSECYPCVQNLLLEWGISQLESLAMFNISETDRKIWSGSDGDLVINILDKKQQKDYSRLTKDEQWEESIRKEIEKKQPKKLTKEEEKLVGTQLRKESEIRKQVQFSHLKAIKIIQLIEKAIRGNAENFKSLLSIGNKCWKLLMAHVGSIVEKESVNCLLSFSASMNAALGNAKIFWIVIFLKLFDCKVDGFLVEMDPLKEASLLIKKLHEPLDDFSFSIFFNLVKEMISKNYDLENCLFFISNHVQLAKNPNIPRLQIFTCLFQVIDGQIEMVKTCHEIIVKMAQIVCATGEEISYLLHNLMSPNGDIRYSALAALELMEFNISETWIVWVLRNDPNERNAAIAKRIWDECAVCEEYISFLSQFLVHEIDSVRSACAKSVADAMERHPSTVTNTIKHVLNIFASLTKEPEPELNEYGIPIPIKDNWEKRMTISEMLFHATPAITQSEQWILLFKFMLQVGLTDLNENTRQSMLKTGMNILSVHGKPCATLVIPLLEEHLSNTNPTTRLDDEIHTCVVILLGTACKHLDSSEKVSNIINQLIACLKTPSESVQYAVAQCMPPLLKMHFSTDKCQQLVSSFMDGALSDPSLAIRRGSAYGVAAVIKSQGISKIKEYSILERLKQSVDNKERIESRQGALFVMEMLSSTLDRLFEPFVIQILPLLLLCFGDGRTEIRTASDDAAKVIMGSLSGHCVKLVLPSLLQGLNDRAWRTKQGSVQLLGSMAFLAPKQLAMNLPIILPKLTECLSDPHIHVQATAKKSLEHFGSIIRNQEIHQLVPLLLKALSEPSKHTSAALTALVNMKLVHYLDAASLALVVPVLHRGLKERSADDKKKAAQIAAHLCSLAQPNDFLPYVSLLVPDLQEMLGDPVPEARSISAKALGALVERFGEKEFPTIIDTLIEQLGSTNSSADRSGAAQALAEVIKGLGFERLGSLLPLFIDSTKNSRSNIREGFLSLFVYLPHAFGNDFAPYVREMIPVVLSGLADDNEEVRQVALKAGRVLVIQFCSMAVDTLLPELEGGMSSVNWRIRHSSVTLMGDLLSKLTSDIEEGEAGEDEDEETNHKALKDILGIETRNQVLACLLICRFDVHAPVRNSAVTLWKSLVINSPRTIRELIPTLVPMVIDLLAGESEELAESAARCIADVRFGEHFLEQIIPLLSMALKDEDANIRKGSCLALVEMLDSTNNEHLQPVIDNVIEMVQHSLCDENIQVRQAAAQAFDRYCRLAGNRGIEDIVPWLLDRLVKGDSSSLEALKVVMVVKSTTVLPRLMPVLLASPLTSSNLEAFNALASVSGNAIAKRIDEALFALFRDYSEQVNGILVTLVNCMSAELYQFNNSLEEIKRKDDDKTCTIPHSKVVHGISAAIRAIVGTSKPDKWIDFLEDWYEWLIFWLDEKQDSLVATSHETLVMISNALPKELMEMAVPGMLRALQNVSETLRDNEPIRGFTFPKAISPFFPICVQALVYGTDARESSALCLQYLVTYSSSDSLKTMTTQIIGPLIRVIGERMSPETKLAILKTIHFLFLKVESMLKPFLPQLQRSFVKCLADTSADVRKMAAFLLGVLIPFQSRIEPLLVELVSALPVGEQAIQVSVAMALYQILSHMKTGISESVETNAIGVLVDLLNGNSNYVRMGASLCLCAIISKNNSINAEKLMDNISDLTGKLIFLLACLFELNTLNTSTVPRQGISSSDPAIKEWSVRCCCKMILNEPQLIDSLLPNILSCLIPSNDVDVRRTSLEMLIILSNAMDLTAYNHLILPPIIFHLKEKIVSLKVVAERAIVAVLMLTAENPFLDKDAIASLDPQLTRYIVDYHSRVLVNVLEKKIDEDDEFVCNVDLFEPFRNPIK